jgi:hypothetical protein
MLKMIVKIGRVDMDGYWGRENHPEKTDSGQTAELMSVELQRFNPEPVDDADFVKVRMADGRVVDLVETEIESITTTVVEPCECCEEEDPTATLRSDAVPPAVLCDTCYRDHMSDRMEEADRKGGLDLNP